jgi:TPR repeat protein
MRRKEPITKQQLLDIRQQAFLGCANAQYNLAVAYHRGHLVRPNYRMAKEWYAKALKSGNPAGAYGLGWFGFHETNGKEKHMRETVRLLMIAAAAEIPEAINLLGCCYEKGLGTKKNYRKAFALYKRAAEGHGEIDAINNIGWLYLVGKGVRMDAERAAHYFKRACDLGNAEAMCNLAYCYQEGLGVIRSIKKCIFWNKKGAINGEKLCKKNLLILGSQE